MGRGMRETIFRGNSHNGHAPCLRRSDTQCSARQPLSGKGGFGLQSGARMQAQPACGAAEVSLGIWGSAGSLSARHAQVSNGSLIGVGQR
jgi:hypothetical protein